MAAIRGRITRPENAPTVLLQARVAPEVRDEVRLAAAASGVSLNYYLEALLKEQIAAGGALPVIAARRNRDALELPITAA